MKSIAAVITLFLLAAFSSLGGGATDPSFQYRYNVFDSGNGPTFRFVAVQPDGRLAVTGKGGNDIEQINPDGALNAGIDLNLYGTPTCVAVQADAKILVGGSPNGNGAGLLRLKPDWTVDSTFAPDLRVFGGVSINCVAVQSDERILVGGSSFGSPEGQTRQGLVRIKPDGALDGAFNPQVLDGVYCIALQESGQSVIGGRFSSVAGATQSRLARLNTDGTLDPSFHADVAGEAILAIALQADGKMVVGGEFTAIAGHPRNGLARLNADGTLDMSFDPIGPGVRRIGSILLQADGKMIVVGRFVLGGVERKIARLNADGSVDPFFSSSVGSSGGDFEEGLDVATLQADGKILVGKSVATRAGNFTALIRLLNEPATQTLSVPDSSRVRWLRGGTSPETKQVSFELSTDGGDRWTRLGVGVRIGGGWELGGLNLPATCKIRARARITGGSLVEAVTTRLPLPIAAGITSDFNGDGKTDYVLSHQTGGELVAWFMNVAQATGWASGLVAPAGWSVAGSGDFNGDGKVDLVLFNPSTRQTVIWYLDGFLGIGAIAGPSIPVGWSLRVADFNGDGKPDYLLYNNAVQHDTGIWYLSGVKVIGWISGPSFPQGWSVHAADFNGDARADFVLYNDATRQTVVWNLDGAMVTSWPTGPIVPAGYTLVGVGDFNGDRKSDYLAYNAVTGQTLIWLAAKTVPSWTPAPVIPAGWIPILP